MSCILWHSHFAFAITTPPAGSRHLNENEKSRPSSFLRSDQEVLYDYNADLHGIGNRSIMLKDSSY